jgi:2-polyprenyl-6-methoxyphenol hydroxylase-like FAD-dependent oxidoreductase
MGAGKRAVVIGGGMGGLAAAGALVDHFDEVVIVERDVLPEGAATRKGTPQAPHLHGILKRGEQILDGFFPGLFQDLRRDGAQPVTLGSEMHWYHFDRWKAQCEHGIPATFTTRPFLEAAVRRRVRALKKVRWLEGTTVLGLDTDAGKKRVTGIVHRPADGGRETTLDADLVVDSAGRGSQAIKWLESLGYPRALETEIKVNVGYSTCVFKRKNEDRFPWKALVVVPANSKRMAGIMPVEDGNWVASAAGFLHDYPPADREGYLEFMRTLPVDGIYRMIADAEPVSEISTTRFPSNRWVRYDKMARFPDGYLVMGDAVGCYNPVYGQGMTIAAIHAEHLSKLLRERRQQGLDGLHVPFRKRVADAVNDAWRVSSSEDYRFPEVEGARPPGYSGVMWYMDRIHAAASADPVVYERFLKVMHMIEPFPTLMSPTFAFRVIRSASRVFRQEAAGGSAHAGP